MLELTETIRSSLLNLVAGTVEALPALLMAAMPLTLRQQAASARQSLSKSAVKEISRKEYTC